VIARGDEGDVGEEAARRGRKSAVRSWNKGDLKLSNVE